MEETEPMLIDVGIGFTEYQGVKMYHSEKIVVSNCCEEPVLLININHYEAVYAFWEHYDQIPDPVKDELGITLLTQFNFNDG
jgi:hypothetical protein